jgi:Cdc6-like AAA superfamily ATPase
LEEAKFAEDRAAHLQSPTVAGQDQARLVGNRRGAGNDTVAQQEDQLNFENYVQAFCDLIRSADTKPPLTIGIFGSWGMGKSFLLKEIERSIRELQKDPQDSLDPREQRKAWKETRRRRRQDLQQGRTDPSVSYVHVVRFNAWEYSATEVVWPGLVRKIMDRLEVETSNGAAGRLAARLRRNLRRQIMRNRSRLYAAAIIVPVLIAIGITQIQADSLVLGGAALAIGAGLIKVASDGLSRPISQWVTTLFEDQDYGKQIGYMADIRDDLEFLANRLRRDQGRILVTIDDLDRCEPEKAVEVLEAVNLLLNFDSFIVCLGIDARVVTRAVEEHYKGLLGPAGASGYEYLDKVVQIPFRIPEPQVPTSRPSSLL